MAQELVDRRAQPATIPFLTYARWVVAAVVLVVAVVGVAVVVGVLTFRAC